MTKEWRGAGNVESKIPAKVLLTQFVSSLDTSISQLVDEPARHSLA